MNATKTFNPNSSDPENLQNFNSPLDKHKNQSYQNRNIGKLIDYIVSNLSKVDTKDWEHFAKNIKVNDDTFLNPCTNTKYSGFNSFMCFIDTLVNNRICTYYATFKNISDNGGKVNKGAKGIPVYFTSKIYFDLKGNKLTSSEVREAEENNIPIKFKWFLKTYTVFNLDDTTGMDDFLNYDISQLKNIQDIPECEAFITNVENLEIIYSNSNKAFYNPGKDVICLPNKPFFNDEIAYYNTLFHELIHWTGHESRLKRNFENDHNSYSFEELIAELGSMLLCNYFGCGNFLNSVIYLKSWLGETENPREKLNSAFTASTKAFNYLKKYAY